MTDTDLEKLRERLPTGIQRAAAEKLSLLLRCPEVVVGGYLPAERDLAELVGVSRPTLRLVLKEMQALGAIRIMGKGRLRAAESLPQDVESVDTNTVAVIVSQPPGAVELGGFHHSGLSYHVHYGVMDALHAFGDNAFMFKPESFREKTPAYLRRMGIRGVVMLPGRDAALRGLLEEAQRSNVPTVVWGEEAWSAQLDRVASDHAMGAYALSRGLLKLGCRRILRYWVRDLQQLPAWVAQRDEGYERAMREASIPILPALHSPSLVGPHFDLIDTPEKFQTYVRLAAGYLLDYLRGPDAVDAIMAPDDHAAIWLAAACRVLGRTPGKDIHIVGYDNCADDTAHWKFEPTYPTYTVDKSNIRIGWELVGLLKDRQNGKLPPEPQLRRVPSQLIIPATGREVPVDEFCKELDASGG